jgi:hypothetical protein
LYELRWGWISPSAIASLELAAGWTAGRLVAWTFMQRSPAGTGATLARGWVMIVAEWRCDKSPIPVVMVRYIISPVPYHHHPGIRPTSSRWLIRFGYSTK